MERCLAKESDMGGVGCDNMTITIVAILNGRTKEEWYNWIVPKATPLGETDDIEPSNDQSGENKDDSDDDDMSSSPTPAGMQMFMRMLQSHAGAGLAFTRAEEEEAMSPLYANIDPAIRQSLTSTSEDGDNNTTSATNRANVFDQIDPSTLAQQIVESPGPETRTFDQTTQGAATINVEEKKTTDHHPVEESREPSNE
jgi:hypothetical protein